MSDELMITNTEFKNTKLRNYTNQIYKQGLSIKKSYARIASILAKIDTSKCYEMDGFESIHDYSKKVLGINKSTSYAFLKIGYEYIDSKSFESVLKHDEGNDFSMSQLQAVLPLKSVDVAKELAEHNEINPNMSVKEIKEVVKNYKNEGTETEEKEEQEKQEIIDVEAVDSESYHPQSVIELVSEFKEGTGKHSILYGDELLTLEQAIQIITDWMN